MPTPRADRRLALLLAAAVATAAAVAVALLTGVRTEAWPSQSGGTWNGLVPARPPVALPARAIVLLRAPSLADRVLRAHGKASAAQERHWTAAARAAQDALVARFSAAGIELRPELRFTRVLDGFSALVEPATAALLERDPGVAGVYPVRVAYPAADAASVIAGPSFGPRSGHRLPPPDGLDGSGVTIALLDTHVDASVAYLHGAVLPEIDLVGGAPGGAERHGTEMAGLLAGRGGPGGLEGAAPGARVLPIRVAGLQPESGGGEAVFARSDQIVAGLDRAVDPNGDGDAHDAVRVALLALAEPYAGFADSPEARAIAGAQALDTLVVVPAGNDGPAGARFGDLSGPGGAASALTVGALDARLALAQTRVSLGAGGVRWQGTVPLAGAVEPGAALQAPLVRSGGAIEVGGGAAALVSSPPPAAGGLPLARADVPAIALPSAIAAAVRRALAAGASARLTLAPAPPRANPGAGKAAPFSSTGLSFAGLPKPELLAPGVALATADPNGPGGAARWTTVSGTSAAAAAVAGDAAVVARRHADLDAAELRSLLVGHASGAHASAADAVAGSVVASPATLAPSGGTARIVLTNVGPAKASLRLRVAYRGGAATLAASLAPSRLVLAPGASASVRLRVTATPAGAATVAGAVVVTGSGAGVTTRIPWALRFPAKPVSLLGAVTLSTRVLTAGDPSPAVLSVDAGRVLAPASRPDIRALSRLDVVLWHGARRLGLIARLRDVLPGRYTFGLTGRGPAGGLLRPGTYAVEVVAVPVDGGKPSRRLLRFALR